MHRGALGVLWCHGTGPGLCELGHRQIWIGFFDMYFDWCSGPGIADLDWLFDMYLFWLVFSVGIWS